MRSRRRSPCVDSGIVQHHVGQARALLRVVRESRVLADQVDDVHAEAVDASVEPEPQHVVHRLLDLGVRPVQVGLLGQEAVQVVLAGGLVERPCRLCP